MKGVLLLFSFLLARHALAIDFAPIDDVSPFDELVDQLEDDDKAESREDAESDKELVQKRALNCRSIFTKTSTINGYSCPQAINVFGSYLCYRYDGFAQDCCYKCNSLRTNQAGCIYGDKLSGCKNLRPSDCYMPSNQRQCCATCPRHRKGPAGCEYGDQNVAQCGVMIPSNPGNCYNAQNRKVCCATCQRYRTNIQGCEYGDRAASWRTRDGYFPNCRSLINYYGATKCKEYNVKSTCCASCNGRKRALEEEADSKESEAVAEMEEEEPDKISPDLREQTASSDDVKAEELE